VSPDTFRDGLVAIVEDVSTSGWPADPVTITAASIRGDSLHLTLRYGGGCGKHRFGLLFGSAFLESFPVQVHARVAHDAGGDMCDALLSSDVAFDLTPLKRHYRTSYGPGGATIIIRLSGPSQRLPYTFE
jgi:hypothetical protein